jgi:hypothetical protein
MPSLGTGIGIGITPVRRFVTFTGMLESRTGIAAAYSLRRLFTSYDGPVIRLRRDSDNQEKDFYVAAPDVAGFGTLRNDTGQSVGVWSAAADVFVSQWFDQSGADRHVSHETATEQPWYNLASEDEKPLIFFDGEPRGLEADFSPDLAQPNGIHIVLRFAEAAPGRYVVAFAGPSGAENAMGQRNTGGHFLYASDTEGSTDIPTGAERYVFYGEFMGGSTFFSVNSDVLVTTVVGNGSFGGLTFGHGHHGLTDAPMLGEIGEFVIWDTPPEDYEAVSAEMQMAWGIA